MQQNIRENNNENNKNDKEKSRQLSWFGGSSGAGISTVSELYLVDPAQSYDKWAQAYRMLGGYIDCDHKKEGNDHHSGDNNNNNNNNGDVSCSRWMIWAAVRLFLLLFFGAKFCLYMRESGIHWDSFYIESCVLWNVSHTPLSVGLSLSLSRLVCVLCSSLSHSHSHHVPCLHQTKTKHST